MRREQQMVFDFHAFCGIHIAREIGPQDAATRELRARLIAEEAQETCEALRGNDFVGAADGLADLAYVVLGTAVSLGIDLEDVFKEVHRSNMTKLWAKGELDRVPAGCTASPSAASGLYVVRDAYGKAVKSPTYSPADVAGVLRKLGYDPGGDHGDKSRANEP